MIRDKRGIGTTISMWFVLIVILAIGIIFVVISASIGSFRNSDFQETFYDDGFLLNQVTIGESKIFVLEAITLYSQEKIEREVIDSGLMGLVDERDSCLALALGDEENPAGKTGGAALDDFFIVFDDGVNSLSTGARPLALSRYSSEGVLSDLFYSNPETQEIIYVQYYHGKCLEDINE